MKRKFIDERGRFFGIISAVDILVIIVALALGAAVYMRFFEKEETATSIVNTAFSYQIKLDNMRSNTADALRVGDKVYDNENGTYLGTITAIDVSDAQKDVMLGDGSIVLGSVEDRYDVILDIDASGLISNGRYYASRTYEICTNNSMDIYTKYCSTRGTVWSVG